jgi:uncharacterized protein HemX
MKELFRNQKGSLHIVAVLAVLMVGFAGYHVYQVNKKPKTTATTQNPTQQKFTSSSDLKTASSSLDNDESNTTVDPSQLDADLNSIL